MGWYLRSYWLKELKELPQQVCAEERFPSLQPPSYQCLRQVEELVLGWEGRPYPSPAAVLRIVALRPCLGSTIELALMAMVWEN